MLFLLSSPLFNFYNLDGLSLQKKDSIVEERRRAIISEGFERELEIFIALVKEYIDMMKRYCASDYGTASSKAEEKIRGEELQGVCYLKPISIKFYVS